MKPEYWSEVEALFAGASELPEERRAAFLEQASTSPEVRAEVKALLGWAHTAGRDLGAIVANVAASVQALDAAIPAVVPGQLLGPYRIVESIGRGAMGEVYAAEDSRLGRKVALKILPGAFSADPERVRRFQTEARAASTLNHPNIVTVHDLGNDGGRYYIATEFIAGRTLRAMMQSAPLKWQTAVDIARQTAEALEAAHSAGILHRDIKPENIMVRPDGYVRVLDFGLAKLVAADSGPDGTLAGMVMGTPSYMSPEQARGEVLDGRSDLFSLGVVIFEMLNGRTPFRRSTTVETLAAVLEREAPPLELPAGAPADLRRITARLLEKDRERRFPSAGALLEALRATQERVLRPSRRTLLAVGGGAVAAAAAGAWWLRPTGIRLNNMQVRRLSPRSGTVRVVLSPDGRDVLLVSRDGRELTVSLAPVENPGDAREIAAFHNASCVGASFAPDGRSVWLSIEDMSKPDGGTLYRMPLPQGSPQPVFNGISSAAIFHRDGERIVFTRATSEFRSLYVANPDGSGQKQLGTGPEFYTYVSFDWSPDGRSVLFIEAARVNGKRVWRLMRIPAEGGLARQLYSTTSPLDDVASVHGDLVLLTVGEVATRTYQIRYSYRDGPFQRWSNDTSSYSQLVADRAGKRLAAWATRISRALWTIDLPATGKTSAAPQRVPVDHVGFGHVGWTSAGQIAYSSESGSGSDVWLVNQDGSSGRGLTSGARLNFDPVVSPDLKTVVFVSNRDGLFRLWRMGIDGSNVRPISAGPSDGRPYMSFDGKWIYYASDSPTGFSAFRIPLDGGTPELVLAQTLNPPAVSPDGHSMAYLAVDPVDRRTKLVIRREGGTVPLRYVDGPIMASLQFTPDNRGLLYLSHSASEVQVRYCAVAGGEPQVIATLPFRTVNDGHFSPDCRRLAFVSEEADSDLVLFENFR